MATDGTPSGSLNYQAAKAALKSLQDLSRPDHPIPVAERAGEGMIRAANLMDRIKDCAWGGEVRRRAGRLAEMTGPQSDFESARARFAEALSETSDPPEDTAEPGFLSLRDDRNGFADYPRRLAQVTEMVRLWRLDLPPGAVGTPNGTFPPLTEVPPEPSKGKKRAAAKSKNLIPNPPAEALNPQLRAEELSSSLTQLATADRQHQSWACYLLQLCHDFAKSGSEDQEAQGWLAGLWMPFTPVLEAMQRIVTEIIEERLLTTHGPGYRSVTWFGRHHTFSPTQAECVRVLWGCWEGGAMEMSVTGILKAAASQSDRLQDVFKGHPTWKELMRPTQTRGCWALNIPSSTDDGGKPLYPA